MLLQACGLGIQKLACSRLSLTSKKQVRKPTVTCLRLGIEDIAHIAQNKVLIAATTSAAIGQLFKPFTSAILYGKPIDFKAAIQASGFPSTHSSAVVAAATCLALERGFSDSIFGMAVVFAGLFMFDAQGVRREVGIHAKVLNKHMHETKVNSVSSVDTTEVPNSKPGTSSGKLETFGTVLSQEEGHSSLNMTKTPVLERPDMKATPDIAMPLLPRLAAEFKEGSNQKPSKPIKLKESIGHTKIEVTAGALLGLLVSLAIYTIM
ncbi:Protein of unknown function DUF212 [Dillenia turbinata]|uniref:Uncharacterized protein n=1 Tax=Dillenia turbinata TaxID=194707 RepID=A0AAN8WF48_9MAGN